MVQGKLPCTRTVQGKQAPNKFQSPIPKLCGFFTVQTDYRIPTQSSLRIYFKYFKKNSPLPNVGGDKGKGGHNLDQISFVHPHVQRRRLRRVPRTSPIERKRVSL
jgi:hypothetical protein